MDIKYILINGEKRNALLLTVLDVYTRNLVGHVLWWYIAKEYVIWLLHNFLEQHDVNGMALRNDNGSQFIAYYVSGYLKELNYGKIYSCCNDHIYTALRLIRNKYIQTVFRILSNNLLVCGKV